MSPLNSTIYNSYTKLSYNLLQSIYLTLKDFNAIIILIQNDCNAFNPINFIDMILLNQLFILYCKLMNLRFVGFTLQFNFGYT